MKNSQGSYDYDHSSMLEVLSSLGIPWHPDKGDSDFVNITKFIGFIWDLVLKHVSLPEEKHLKYVFCLEEYLEKFKGHPAPLLNTKTIHGTLCHIAFLHANGCSHLPAISNFMALY